MLFNSVLVDDEVRFGYMRVNIGDNNDPLYEFALITWIGRDVPVLQINAVTRDRNLVKEVITVKVILIYI